MELFPNTNAFIKVIEETSKQHGGRQITRLWLKAGPGTSFMSGMSEYIEAILKGTAAREAEIFINRGEAIARCCSCGLVYGSEKQEDCSACGGIVERISLGRSFIIDSMELKDI